MLSGSQNIWRYQQVQIQFSILIEKRQSYIWSVAPRERHITNEVNGLLDAIIDLGNDLQTVSSFF